MTRAFFVLGIIGAAMTLRALRVREVRRTARAGAPEAGRCANQRRKLRWSGYTAASLD